jgi:hypothetical protein
MPTQSSRDASSSAEAYPPGTPILLRSAETEGDPLPCKVIQSLGYLCPECVTPVHLVCTDFGGVVIRVCQAAFIRPN